MRTWFISLLVFAFALTCEGQDSLRLSTRKMTPKQTFKISPFHLFGFFPTVQVAFEQKVSDFWTLQLEGGYVINVVDEENVTDVEYWNKRGFKTKVEPRFYFHHSRNGRNSFYQATEFYFNKADYDQRTDQVECFDPECINQYRRTYTYTTNMRERGLALKVGLLQNFNGFILEYTTGFATRFIDYDRPAHIHPPERDYELFDTPKEYDRIGFMPVLNFKLGYRIR